MTIPTKRIMSEITWVLIENGTMSLTKLLRKTNERIGSDVSRDGFVEAIESMDKNKLIDIYDISEVRFLGGKV